MLLGISGCIAIPEVPDASGSTGPVTLGSTAANSTVAHSTGLDESGSSDDTATPPDLPPEDIGDCARLAALVAALPEAAADEREPMIDDYIRTVSDGEHGFPGIEGTQLCVVARGFEGEALSVTGEFSDWDPRAHPLAEVPDLGFYYAIVELPAPPVGRYKLARNEATFLPDPLARRIGWDELGEYGLVDPVPGRSHIERWPAFESGAGTLEPRAVRVYVPAGGFAPEDVDVPVLYMHDGQNLFSTEASWGGWRVDETLDHAIEDGLVPPMLIVGIDNTPARFDEYTHVPNLFDGEIRGGRADDYADFLVDGIKPFIESRYPAATEAARVGTMGASLGGLVSLHLGHRHPDVFGHVASMSGTLGWGQFGEDNPTMADRYRATPPAGLRVYLDSGGDSPGGCPGSTDNYCVTQSMADTLRDLGWVDEDDLVYRWDPGAPHTNAQWADRFLPALLDWFKPAQTTDR